MPERLLNAVDDFTMPLTTVDKVMIGVDGLGVCLSIVFFGCGFKAAVDDWLPTIILIITVVSISLTIAKKVYDFIRVIKKNKP